MDTQLPAEVQQLAAPEDGALASARSRAGKASRPPSPEVGALLAFVAASVSAKAAVEVGSAGGVSGLWLLRGLEGRGALTSIEPDPHAQGLASDAYAAAGAGTRVRSILGDPDTVLPRLADAGYDLVVLQADGGCSPADLVHARRLLRPGGALVARGVTRRGDHAERRARFLQELVEDEGFVVAVLPVDDGVALATRLADEG